MRKLVCILFLVIMGTVTLSAQERDSGDIEIETSFGYTASFINGDFVDVTSTKSSIRFGANVDFYLNDRWSIRTGLNYDNLGAESIGEKLELIYVTIPANINWHFGSTRKWNLNFGFSSGLLTAAKLNDVKVDGAKSFQLSVSYGIGYKLEVSRNISLMFDIQNQVGITSYLEDDSIKRSNAASSFNIGVVFEI